MSRWPAAFPQYTPGHLAHRTALDATLAEEAPGVHITGAAYHGMRIPALVRAARSTASAVRGAPPRVTEGTGQSLHEAGMARTWGTVSATDTIGPPDWCALELVARACPPSSP